MDTMYKLTKQIDALTYNSRAVLNALVRSCIAAGSSNGYTVKRFGEEMTLTRDDIYRLYDFYQSWANGTYGYAPYTTQQEEFDAIVERCDAKWKEPGLVTESLVKHSKIMYLVSTNRTNRDDGYWLGLIKNASSPKLIANSAPIPLNLRTPLYDADLSTKSFSQHETYLFPSGYNKIAITGMPGDGETHIGGGRSWTWDIDESFDLTAPRIRFGQYTDTKRRLENYGTTEHSFSYGYDTYALGEYSVSLGGIDNVAYAPKCATVGGYELLALGDRSAIAGGNLDVTLGMDSFAFGIKNHAVAPGSMAGNEMTCAGGFAYKFTIEEPGGSGTKVECETIADSTTGQCVDVTSTVTSGDGRSIIRIPYEQIAANGMWTLYIEKGDLVTIYAQTRKGGLKTFGAYDSEGYTFKPLKFHVTDISRSNGDFLVQLDGGIPRGETFESLWVDGGYVVTSAALYREQDWNGNLQNPVEWVPGYASNALNYCTVASGIHQTVVGQMNWLDRDAKFVVGTGSSYVGAGAFRRNGLAISQGYGYMQTASRSAIIGVSDFERNLYRDYDGRYLRHGAWMFHHGDSDYEGHVVAYDEATEIGLSNIGTNEEDNKLIFVRSGSSYLSTTHDVTVCMEARAGTMVINAGSYIGVQHSYDVLLNDGVLDDDVGGSLAIYSENGMELRNTNSDTMMSFHNSGYISATFSGLILHGNTWGALSTTDDALSYWVYHHDGSTYGNAATEPGHDVDYPNAIAQSGFFYGDNGYSDSPIDGKINLPTRVSTGEWEDRQGGGFHILNSAVRHKNNGGNDGYDVSCLIMPGNLTTADVNDLDKPHVKFINSFIYGTGNNGVMPNETFITEELAYLSDVERARNISYTAVCNPSRVQYRALRSQDGAVLAPDFPQDYGYTYSSTSHPFTDGSIAPATGNAGNQMDYFNYYAPYTSSGATVATNPVRWICGNSVIAAPMDNPANITLVRHGQIVMLSIMVTFAAEQFTEIQAFVPMIVNSSSLNILEALGFKNQSDVILSGAGFGGTQVTCTIANNMTTSVIEPLHYPTANILDFVLYNPSQTRLTASITLTGTVTKNANLY